MEISGPPLTALSADELLEWADFLRLIIRQAERLAAKQTAMGVPPGLIGEPKDQTV